LRVGLDDSAAGPPDRGYGLDDRRIGLDDRRIGRNRPTLLSSMTEVAVIHDGGGCHP
jgi:hypothetical protein